MPGMHLVFFQLYFLVHLFLPETALGRVPLLSGGGATGSNALTATRLRIGRACCKTLSSVLGRGSHVKPLVACGPWPPGAWRWLTWLSSACACTAARAALCAHESVRRHEVCLPHTWGTYRSGAYNHGTTTTIVQLLLVTIPSLAIDPEIFGVRPPLSHALVAAENSALRQRRDGSTKWPLWRSGKAAGYEAGEQPGGGCECHPGCQCCDDPTTVTTSTTA